MKDGYIKVSAVSPEIRVADVDFNTNTITQEIIKAHENAVKLLVFPELCVTGYTIGDLIFQDSLLNSVRNSLDKIKQASLDKNMLIAVGAPLVIHGKLYNTAVIICNGEFLGCVPKKYVPNYNEFYEMRYFSVYEGESIDTEYGKFGYNIVFESIEKENFSVGFEICEDLWAIEPPSIKLAGNGAKIIGNLSASNELVGKNDYRRSLVIGQSARLLCGYVYANAGQGESTTDMVFSGNNIIAENGIVLAENESFSGKNSFSEIDVDKLQSERIKNTSFPQKDKNKTIVKFSSGLTDTVITRYINMTPFVPNENDLLKSRAREVLMIQAHGLSKRVEHTNAAKLVIGVSGGLDSSLAVIVAAETLKILRRPMSDLIGITMPCFGTTSRTKNNAVSLVEALSGSLMEIDITKSVTQHFMDIGQDINVHDVTFENAQARERTQVLMDAANKMNGLVIGTGDLSELALGWATYNGDHMSMYGVNASVPKTLIRHIVEYYMEISESKILKDTLRDILNTPVSPELIPAKNDMITQKTEDIVGPYELHDFFLYYGIRYSFSPRKVFRLAKYAFIDVYSAETILKWLAVFYRRFFSAQFKRSCVPDAPKVGSVSLSPRGDLRMPSDAAAKIWLDEINLLINQS